MSEHKIDISWQMKPLVTSGVEAVPNKELNRHDSDPDLCRRLGWHEDTLAVLRHAFERRLSRFAGWDANTDYATQSAIADAAGVYRRGVPVMQNTLAESEEGRYPILFQKEHHIRAGSGSFFVVDANVKKHHPDLNWPTEAMVWEPSEDRKSLVSVAEMLEAWEQAGKPQQWMIYGGGILSDTAAFAAALVGARFTFVPTTLLAMADACVGGKTGVNFPPFGKNQVGLFDFPEQVIICERFLETLSRRHLNAGGAECLKHALLSRQRDLLQIVMQKLTLEPIQFGDDVMAKIIGVKADVISRDPNESGERAILNLGHTLAHALEAHCAKQGTSQQLYHGEAVAAGLFFMTYLSEQCGHLKGDTAEKMRQMLIESTVMPPRSQLNKALGQPLQQQSFSGFMPFLQQDKKADGGETRWVLLSNWGTVVKAGDNWTIAVSDSHLHQAWSRFVDGYIF